MFPPPSRRIRISRLIMETLWRPAESRPRFAGGSSTWSPGETDFPVPSWSFPTQVLCLCFAVEGLQRKTLPPPPILQDRGSFSPHTQLLSNSRVVLYGRTRERPQMGLAKIWKRLERERASSPAAHQRACAHSACPSAELTEWGSQASAERCDWDTPYAKPCLSP